MTALGVHTGNGWASVIRKKGKGFSRYRIDLVCYFGCRCHPSHFWVLFIMAGCMLSFDSCTVQLLPSRTLDDGFDRLAATEKMKYKGSCSNVVIATLDSQPDTLTVFESHRTGREWHPEEIVAVARQHRLTWLMIVSSWCPHARSDVARWYELQQRLSRADIATVVLSTDYEVSYLSSVQPMDSGFAFVGIASVGDYHDDQLEKCNRFQKVLFPSCPPSAGLPRHYLLDSTGALVTWHFGELYDPGFFLNAEELE